MRLKHQNWLIIRKMCHVDFFWIQTASNNLGISLKRAPLNFYLGRLSHICKQPTIAMAVQR